VRSVRVEIRLYPGVSLMSAGGWIADLLGYKDILSGAVCCRDEGAEIYRRSLSDNPTLGTTDITLAGTATRRVQIADGIHGGVRSPSQKRGRTHVAPMASTDIYKSQARPIRRRLHLDCMGLSSGVGVWEQVI